MSEITVGEAIKKARTDRGYSQQRLSNKTGIPVSTIANWEQGFNYPTVINLIPVADAIEITLDELVGRRMKI